MNPIKLFCFQRSTQTRFIKEFWWMEDARRYVRKCRKDGDIYVYGCTADEIEEVDYIMGK